MKPYEEVVIQRYTNERYILWNTIHKYIGYIRNCRINTFFNALVISNIDRISIRCILSTSKNNNFYTSIYGQNNDNKTTIYECLYDNVALARF